MRVAFAAGVFEELARHAADDDLRHAVFRRTRQRMMDEIADPDHRIFRKFGEIAFHRRFRTAARSNGDPFHAFRRKTPHLQCDRGGIRGIRIGMHDPAAAQDGNASDDPEHGIQSFLRSLFAFRRRYLHQIPPPASRRQQVLQQHLARHRIDCIFADRHRQAGTRHPPDPLPAPDNQRKAAFAFLVIGVIRGVLERRHFHKQIHDGFLECDESEGKLSAMAQENLTGVRVVRAFGQEKAEMDKFTKQNDSYTSLWIRMAKIMSRFWSVSDIFSGIQVMLVVIFGAYFCIRGSLTEGEYIAFISYNSMLVWPIRQLGRMISEMSKAGVSIDRVAYIMHSPAESDDPDAADAPMDGDICFEHVSFAYENAPELLHDIHFTMKAGTTLGILGGTGSGKSTLMLLLDKLYLLDEDCGRITIGGTDIRKIRTEHLRKNIGMVLQEPFLFSRTIAENIGIASPEMDMQAIRAAAEAAALDETITSFASGYETMVGERGVTLSGGQKQRAAIARMLTAEMPIMIFDDSLSAVDTQTDAKIRQAIAKRFGKASVILISHRITTLSAADKIIVLDRGRIAEEGTHEELKQNGGIYQKIYEAQSGAQEVAV